MSCIVEKCEETKAMQATALLEEEVEISRPWISWQLVDQIRSSWAVRLLLYSPVTRKQLLSCSAKVL